MVWLCVCRRTRRRCAGTGKLRAVGRPRVAEAEQVPGLVREGTRPMLVVIETIARAHAHAADADGLVEANAAGCALCIDRALDPADALPAKRAVACIAALFVDDGHTIQRIGRRARSDGGIDA